MDIQRLIEDAITKAGGVRPLARKWKVSPAYVSDMRHGRRGPGPQILKRLRVVKVVTVAVKYEAE